MINKHTEVGYYSAKMPSPVSNRDFCNLRTWKANPEAREYTIFNFSVVHPDCPEAKGFVRARSLKSGYFVVGDEAGGCTFIYYSQSDPKGWIPSWVINMLMTKLPPKILDKLHKVSLAYGAWKADHEPTVKPWLNTVEDGTAPETTNIAAPHEEKKKKKKDKKDKKSTEESSEE